MFAILKLFILNILIKKRNLNIYFLIVFYLF